MFCSVPHLRPDPDRVHRARTDHGMASKECVKWVVAGILLMALLACSKSFSQTGSNSTKATVTKLVEQARTLEKTYKFSEARATLIKAEEADPRNKDTRKAFEGLQEAIDKRALPALRDNPGPRKPPTHL